jgi:selenide,water dikinase
VLETILQSDLGTFPDPRLLVGYGTRDDAAVYDIGNGRALISTTDFFSPIVDDAFDFGRIAATNALSDVYAMGGKPLLAVAILGWPVEKLPAELAARVIEGGRAACHEAGIALAGGHSIDAPEPFFGLAVTGEVRLEHLKRNDGARPGDVLVLTIRTSAATSCAN